MFMRVGFPPFASGHPDIAARFAQCDEWMVRFHKVGLHKFANPVDAWLESALVSTLEPIKVKNLVSKFGFSDATCTATPSSTPAGRKGTSR
jgi:hypothetical protein